MFIKFFPVGFCFHDPSEDQDIHETVRRGKFCFLSGGPDSPDSPDSLGEMMDQISSNYLQS